MLEFTFLVSAFAEKYWLIDLNSNHESSKNMV